MTVPRVALVGGKPGRGRLQGRDQVDLPGPGADGVSVSEHRVVPVAEQLSAVDVAVDRPGRELEARLPVAGPGMLAASPVRCGGSARARASQGSGSPGVPLRGGRARPGCGGGPVSYPCVPLTAANRYRPALDGRQPPSLATCSGRWSLSAVSGPGFTKTGYGRNELRSMSKSWHGPTTSTPGRCGGHQAAVSRCRNGLRLFRGSCTPGCWPLPARQSAIMWKRSTMS